MYRQIGARICPSCAEPSRPLIWSHTLTAVRSCRTGQPFISEATDCAIAFCEEASQAEKSSRRLSSASDTTQGAT